MTQKIPWDAEPNDADRQQPAVVIGIGAFGASVLQTLAEVTAARQLPFFAQVAVLPDGWHSALSPLAANPTTEWGDLGMWWQAHEAAGIRAIEAAILALPDTDRHQEIDIYLIADWQSAAGRALWLPVLQAARRAHLSFSDRSFTLIIATDSTAFRTFTSDATREVREAVATLTAELSRDGMVIGNVAPIRWCYVVDTLNLYTRPVLGAKGNVVTGRGLQIEHIVEFIAHVQGVLRRVEPYEKSSLTALRHDFRTRGQAWVSAFGAGSHRFPVAEVHTYAEAEMAYRLVARHLHSAEGLTERSRARQIRSDWESQFPTHRKEIRHFLEQGGGEGSLEFPMVPPRMKEVGDETVIETLETWDAVLWSRWNRADAPHALITARAIHKAGEGIDQLRAQMSRLLEQELNGVRVAGYALDEIQKGIEQHHTNPMSEDEQGEAESWLTTLLAAVHLRKMEMDGMPDFATHRARIEVALKGRLNRRAMWVRAVLYAVVLFLFVWAGYSAIERATGLSGLLAQGFGVTDTAGLGVVAVVDAGVLLILCAAVTLFVAALQIGRSEQRIQYAIHAYQEAVRQKYQWLLAQAITQGCDQFYGLLLNEVVAWREQIAERQALWDDVKATLSLSVQLPQVRALATEQIWGTPQGLARLVPPIALEQERQDAERWLVQYGASANRKADIITTIRAWTRQGLGLWRRGLRWHTLHQALGDAPKGIEAIVAELRNRVLPALPVGRDVRAPAIHRSAQELSPNTTTGVPRLAISFVGVPLEAVTVNTISLEAGEHLFATAVAGQVTYLATLHGLDLTRLELWQELPQQEGDDDFNSDTHWTFNGNGHDGEGGDHALERSTTGGGGEDDLDEPQDTPEFGSVIDISAFVHPAPS